MPAKSRREFSGVAGGRWARTVLWLKPEKTSVTAILLSGLTLVALYWFPMRRWFGRWGTTATDLTRVMVGDAAIVDPTYSATLAITVGARPEHSGRGWCKWGISAADCTATTGWIVCSGISIVQARTPSCGSFSG